MTMERISSLPTDGRTAGPFSRRLGSGGTQYLRIWSLNHVERTLARLVPSRAVERRGAPNSRLLIYHSESCGRTQPLPFRAPFEALGPDGDGDLRAPLARADLEVH